jgi:hypothetical protein
MDPYCLKLHYQFRQPCVVFMLADCQLTDGLTYTTIINLSSFHFRHFGSKYKDTTNLTPFTRIALIKTMFTLTDKNN